MIGITLINKNLIVFLKNSIEKFDILTYIIFQNNLYFQGGDKYG